VVNIVANEHRCSHPHGSSHFITEKWPLLSRFRTRSQNYKSKSKFISINTSQTSIVYRPGLFQNCLVAADHEKRWFVFSRGCWIQLPCRINV